MACYNPNPSAIPATQAGLSWRQCIKLWYPQLLKRVYFLPHVYMNRVLYETEQVAGMDVATPQKPVNLPPQGAASNSVLYESDVRDDRTQQHVLYCLAELAKSTKEVFFVLSQMNFGSYLGNPCYSAAAMGFRKPADLKKQLLDRGDFDILIISSKYGLLVGEIKAIGDVGNQAGWTAQQQEAELLKKLRKMWLTKSGKPKSPGQLGKARQVLEYIISDIKPTRPSVRATLILPNITLTQLRQALKNDPTIEQALRTELGLPGNADPVDVCLCSDKMSNHNKPWDVSAGVLQSLERWWNLRMVDRGPDPNINDQVYEEIVSRFAGPATVVEMYCPCAPRLQFSDMRTEGEYVSETGERLTKLALFPSQVQILQLALSMVYLAGPPGTGKTVMLVLMALEWLRLRHRVLILSLHENSQAISHFIKQQLEVTVRKLYPYATGLIDIHFVKLQGLSKALLTRAVEDAALDLVKAAVGNELNIIADEAVFAEEALNELCVRLKSDPSIKQLRVWAASLQPKFAPTCLNLYELTDPLRCPPTVVREIQQSAGIASGNVPGYTDNGVPQPTEGPAIIILHHLNLHQAEMPCDCEQCGEEAGGVLVELLDDGESLFLRGAVQV